tara:strand:+ start:3491 stop:3640 length:150 start_codon:yes stop_codon:yes gene_type:complete
VKSCRLTVKLPWILGFLSAEEAGGIRGVAVKCIDITKNISGEGGLLVCN